MCRINIELKNLHIVLLQLSLNLVFKIIKGNFLTLFISNKLLNNSLKIKRIEVFLKVITKLFIKFFILNWIIYFFIMWLQCFIQTRWVSLQRLVKLDLVLFVKNIHLFGGNSLIWNYFEQQQPLNASEKVYLLRKKKWTCSL